MRLFSILLILATAYFVYGTFILKGETRRLANKVDCQMSAMQNSMAADLEPCDKEFGPSKVIKPWWLI